MTTDTGHAYLLAVIGDALRDGFDTARVHIGPRAEREIVERVCEHLEDAGYHLTLDDLPSPRNKENT